MCGIVGFVERAPRAEALDAMMRAVAHRGPDGSGQQQRQHGGWTVSLGHRRLAIIDVEGSPQPLATDDGRSWITLNGELVNYVALRAQLVEQGIRFRTRGDTEVVLRHWEAHGASGLPELNGMFAYGLWDGAAGQLALVRDRFGIKPLYYAPLPDGGVAFASELTALLEHPAVSRRLARDTLGDYFFSDYVAPPRTIVEGVYKLRPGHHVVWEDGRLSEQRPFWTARDLLHPEGGLVRGSPETLARELWERMRGAIDRYCVSDVPVGAFVSGGIDSAVVARLAQDRASAPVRTYSITFEDPQYDEGPYSRAVARHLGSEHRERRLAVSDIQEALPRILGSLDEPLGDHSYVPTYFLSELAASEVKVVLGGDGGDEVWGGYQSYLAHRVAGIYGRLPRGIREALLGGLASRLPVSHGYQRLDFKIRRFVHRWDDDRLVRHLRWMGSSDLADIGALVGRELAQPGALDCNVPAVPSDPLQECLMLDLCSYLPHSVLTKVDRASMAHGLEVRPPHLDNQLVDWAFTLPTATKLRRWTTKSLLKDAAAPHLPRSVVRRPKQGFGMPLAAMFTDRLGIDFDRILRDSPLWDLGAMDRDTMSRWLANHRARREDRSKTLWAAMVLDHWLRRTGVA